MGGGTWRVWGEEREGGDLCNYIIIFKKTFNNDQREGGEGGGKGGRHSKETV